VSGIEIHGDNNPGNYKNARKIVIQEAHRAMREATFMVEAAWKGRLVPGVRGYRTGHYARSITSDVTPLREAEAHPEGRVTGVVGTNVFYAKYLEYGTGLYGPLHHWITPKKPGGVLRFPAGPVGPGTAFTWAGRRRSGRAGAMAKYVYAKRVRGIRPRRYARDAAEIARPLVVRRFHLAGHQAAHRLGGRG
jgi:hypothetical protein